MTHGPGAEPDRGPTPEGSARPEGFGTATATFVVVSSMVGVGVLTTSGFTVYYVGSNGLMLVLWALGGVCAACGALTIAELSASLPRSGGDYIFLLEAYGRPVAFLSGWVSFLIGFAGPIAALANASATYLLASMGVDGTTSSWAHRAVATAAIVALALVHASGHRGSARVQGWATSLELIVLGLFVVAGLAVGAPHLARLADWPDFDLPTARFSLFSMVYIFYAYSGWNAASYVAGEVDDPGRRLPRAILLGTAVVVALYLGLNTVYGLALPATEVRAIVKARGLDAVEPIVNLAAVRLFGPRVAGPLSMAIGLILIASLSAYILTGPRVLAAMAQAGQFPSVAGRLTPRARTPAIATALQAGWALVLLWTGSFDDLVLYSSVGLAIFSMLAISSVYVLRRRRPDLPRPFRTPGYPVVPAVFLVATAALTAAAFYHNPQVSGLSLASILVGLPFYFLWNRVRGLGEG